MDRADHLTGIALGVLLLALGITAAAAVARHTAVWTDPDTDSTTLDEKQ